MGLNPARPIATPKYKHLKFPLSVCLESKQTLIFEVGKAFAAKLGGKGMSSSALQNDAPDLVCQLDNVQGIVDALSSVRWKRHQVSLSRNLFLGFLP